jgi:hypothetical protein
VNKMLDNPGLDAILGLYYIEINIWLCYFEYTFGGQIKNSADKRGIHQSISELQALQSGIIHGKPVWECGVILLYAMYKKRRRVLYGKHGCGTRNSNDLLLLRCGMSAFVYPG